MTTINPDNLIQPTPSAYTYPLLIKQLLHTPLAVAPDQEIVYRDLKRFNYRTLNHRIAQLANALSALGVRPGDTIGMMDWDSHRYLESYFAVPMMGAVLMTVNVRLSPEQILYTINHAEAKVLLVNVEFMPVLEEIKDKLETAKTFVFISDIPSDPVPAGFAGEYEALLHAASPHYDFPDFDENTRATTFYTTGTTGLPKGVFFSHRQLVLHTLSTMSGLTAPLSQGRLHRDDVYMPITPMFHVHAWGMPYIATVMGLRQVYPGRYTPDGLLALVRQEGVTFSHCVPTILHMLVTNPAIHDTNVKGWKLIIGGSALPKGLAQSALNLGMDLFTGYGMSETCPILTLAQIKTPLMGDPIRELEIRTKTGLPIPLVDLRIVDENMEDLPHDGKAAGEIVVRSPWLTQGYYKNPSASEELWSGGYLHTNDIGVIDPEGYLQVTDRIKDVIKTGGEWVSSLELEDVISRHAAVSEVAVIGIKDAKWGERPMALVVLKSGATATEADIKAHVKAFAEEGHISKFAIPEHVLFPPAIDKTSVGKINKMNLRARYENA
ncbi:fatty acid--CoA ligase [Cognatazoarcus halotolerans]|uniref:fatty acid--CoA ligase n=1 Tax=Cognatazoarcus halotolerans TaxID=2686016 RepID=UPI0013595A07|nr:fatty acid--CoA ligase [Cognatazoarcus halotolerans]MCB1901094.1 fatty acid--CoA ligase [Rhodocyclaceae bacterium]MCP5308907.1 fatty acid--CoA ligase [Zoogloeaceae bacterium]